MVSSTIAISVRAVITLDCRGRANHRHPGANLSPLLWPAGDPSPDFRGEPPHAPATETALVRKKILLHVIVQRRPGQAGACRNGLELPQLFLCRRTAWFGSCIDYRHDRSSRLGLSLGARWRRSSRWQLTIRPLVRLVRCFCTTVAGADMGNRGNNREAPGATRRFEELLFVGFMVLACIDLALLLLAPVRASKSASAVMIMGRRIRGASP
jgi:hypothetical protein